MAGHDHLKCKKCGKYTDFQNARAYGSTSCNCAFMENKRHKELINAIKSISNQPERSKREDLQITGFIENGKEYPLSLPVQDAVL